MAKTSAAKKTSIRVMEKRIGDVQKEAVQLKKAQRQHGVMEEKLERQEKKLNDKIAAVKDRVAASEDRGQISEDDKENLDNRLDAIDL